MINVRLALCNFDEDMFFDVQMPALLPGDSEVTVSDGAVHSLSGRINHYRWTTALSDTIIVSFDPYKNEDTSAENLDALGVRHEDPYTAKFMKRR